MEFLISLLIGTQILCSLARSPPHPGPSPPPPHVPEGLLSPPCNSSSVKEAAELALNKLNEDLKEGYLLGLQRIFDVRQRPWLGTGAVYYLTLDVLETDCHVLSRKSWKNCQFRPAHESVYGQCKATLYINKPSTTHLFTYDCTLRPVPLSAIARLCPDCPVPGDLTDPKFSEAAALSLARFNAENNHTHYFNIRNITKGRSQWVIGPADFVEYVIQETSCSKSQDTTDRSTCPFLPYEAAEVGVCKGSVLDSRMDNRKHVSVECEIFHAQPWGDEGQQSGNRKPGHLDDGNSREGGEHSGSRKGGYQDHQHQRHHPRDHRHRDHPQDHEGQERDPPTADSFGLTEHLGKTVGRVKILPHSLVGTEVEQLDGMPVPPQSQGPKPNPNFHLPDVHDAPEETHPLGKPMERPASTKPARPAVPPPFPPGFSGSDTCPGEILAFVYAVNPLLPKRPVEVSQTGTTEF